MLTVRLRALPDGVGKHYIQGLVDHFFIDIEDRIRCVLQPANPPKSGPVPPAPQSTYTPPTPFYSVANAETRPKGKAPERLVTRQMKILKEQFSGMSLFLDLAVGRGFQAWCLADSRQQLHGQWSRDKSPVSSCAVGCLTRRASLVARYCSGWGTETDV